MHAWHTKERPTRLIGMAFVPKVGIEPTRYCYHWILNPARLPIPPLRPGNTPRSIAGCKNNKFLFKAKIHCFFFTNIMRLVSLY
jgi:hypothetical protein